MSTWLAGRAVIKPKSNERGLHNPDYAQHDFVHSLCSWVLGLLLTRRRECMWAIGLNELAVILSLFQPNGDKSICCSAPGPRASES
jgi:hypothetical protein